MNEISINVALQSLSSPFLDAVMKLLTEFGAETVFIVFAVILYWCVNKQYAYKLVNVYVMGHFCIEGLKAAFVRPRPFTYPEVRSIGEMTGGYSFPSGHSHSVANLSTQLTQKTRKWQIGLGLGILTAVVMFTRLYLGQHFLSDTVMGCAIGIAAAIGFGKLYDLLDGKEDWIFVAALPLSLALAIVLCALEVEAKNLLDILGAYGMFTVGYFLEKKYVSYEPKSGKWYKQVLKVALGLVVILAIKEGAKLVFPAYPFLTEYLRYGLIGFTATFPLPALFKALKL